MPKASFDSLINDILSRTSIVQFIGDFVKLKKVGHSYKGLCPFHSEKTPSFNVNEEKKLFYCFGCQRGGNVITFLQLQMGCSFRDALAHLGRKVGVEIPRDFFRERAVSDDRSEKVSTLKKVCELAAKFYEDSLASDRGYLCRDYILKRGLSEETVKTFRLGFAPDGWDNLVSHLTSRKASLHAAVEAGLVVRKEGRSEFYDRLRNRLVFPVFNLNGEVVGFGGRTLSQDAESAKYLNTSDSPIYKKGENLFGLYQAKNEIRNSGAAVVVEGNVDLLTLFQNGVKNVVAPMGSALTLQQVYLIKRFAQKVYLLFDGDEAGRHAAERAVSVLTEGDLDGFVVILPEGEDPDSYVRKFGVEKLNALIKKGVPAVNFLIDALMERFSTTPHGLKSIIKEFASAISGEKDSFKLNRYKDELARVLQLKPAEIELVMATGAVPVVEKRTFEIADRAEYDLLEVLISDRKLISEFKEKQDTSLVFSAEIRELIEKLIQQNFESDDDLFNFVNDELPDCALKREIMKCIMGRGKYSKPGQASKAYGDIVSYLNKRNEAKRHVEIDKKIRNAESEGRVEEFERLLNEKIRLIRESKRIKKGNNNNHISTSARN